MENIRGKIDSSYKHRADIFEKTFGKLVKSLMVAANPFKKFAFKTPCLMHRFINIQAVHILENEGYENCADFYREMIKPLNEGATWIDQDFKSTNHFYHYRKQKGLYGFSDALSECIGYKNKVDKHINNGNLTRALFYTGVICHLTQDMTVPQHVNNKLLESHRDYEVWILKNAWDKIDFSVHKGIIRYPKFESYIRANTKITNEIYKSSLHVDGREGRYRYMATKLIALTQRVTAGLLLDFYEAYFNNLDNHIEGGLKLYKTSNRYKEVSLEDLINSIIFEDMESLESHLLVKEEERPIVHKKADAIKDFGKAVGEISRIMLADPEEEINIKEARRIERKIKDKGTLENIESKRDELGGSPLKIVDIDSKEEKKE